MSLDRGDLSRALDAGSTRLHALLRGTSTGGPGSDGLINALLDATDDIVTDLRTSTSSGSLVDLRA